MSEQVTQFPDEITVSVTAEHIASGRRKHCSSCPIALALKEKYAPLKALVGKEWLDLADSHWQSASYPTPSAVAEFIGKFDSGEPVEPLGFAARRKACMNDRYRVYQLEPIREKGTPS